jgi:hypothetical protein
MRVLFGTLLLFLIVENSVFNTGFYARILDPDSTAGYQELTLLGEKQRSKPDRDQVLTVGDSRMAFFRRYADQMKDEVNYSFGSIAVAGTTPRCWYYMLREIDPTARGYAAIVIGMNDYDDSESWEDHADRDLDIHYLVNLLRWSDLWEFSRSFHSSPLRWKAAISVVIKGSQLKSDFQNLLQNWRARLDYAELARSHNADWQYTYVGPADNVAGVKLDWSAKTVEMPPALQDKKKYFEDAYLSEPPPFNGRGSAYLKYWLGKIADRYRGTGTRIIFLKLPRGPYLRPDPPPFQPHSSVRDLAARAEVTLMDENQFTFLEKPELFIDPWHLNGPGSAEFSRALARKVRDLLGPPHAL